MKTHKMATGLLSRGSRVRVPPGALDVPLSPLTRFMLFVDARGPSSCHAWLGPRQADGYGSARISGRWRRAHRVAYELFREPIPAGAVVRHVCNNRWCVNPRHLRVGTQGDNMRDKLVSGRSARGSKNGRSKLTEKVARETLRRMAKGERKTDLAIELGVSRRALRFLESGRNWKAVHARPEQLAVLR